MNFQPTITRKELAAKAGCSVRTLVDKYGERLERALCKGIERPVTYFAPRAFDILISAGALSPECAPDAPTVTPRTSRTVRAPS